MPGPAGRCRIVTGILPNATISCFAAPFPRPEKLASGANDRLDFLGQVIYKRQTLGKAAGRSRFT
jgi:hypothetical protein